MIINIKNFNLRTIANSGQCFRINEIDENVFNVQTIDKFLRIIRISNEVYDFKCSKAELIFYKKYFDLDFNYKKIKNVCLDSDKFLKKCINYSDGLKILNQDKFETIISFIISQRKSVKAIKTSIERLSKMAGNKYKNIYGTYYTFPTATQILKLSKNDLRTCGLGYRVDYIVDFCKDYVAGKYDLKKMDKLNNEELLTKLMSIKGVGIKVASCIALFAYHRFDICPKDVWINRVIDNVYKGNYPDNYNKYIGIVQQYWYNYIINTKSFSN